MPGWDEIYPDKRVIALILDPFEAEKLLDQALSEGRRIGERTVLGMPMIAFGRVADDEPSAPAADTRSGDLEAWNRLGRKTAPKTSPDERGKPDAVPVSGDRTGEPTDEKPPRPADNKIAILPVIRRERLPDPAPETGSSSPADASGERRSILDEAPPASTEPAAASPQKRLNKARGKWERSGAISATDRALIDEAIAKGRVTKCPDYKHSVEPGELLPGEGWRKGKRKRK